MLSQWIDDQVLLGAAQAGVTLVAALIVLGLTVRLKLGLKKEILVGLGRGLVQIVGVGFLLTIIFSANLWVSIPIILVMIVAAGFITVQRIKSIPNALWISLIGITAGAGSVIFIMTLLGVIKQDLTSIIPIGSMMEMITKNLTLKRIDELEDVHLMPHTTVKAFLENRVEMEQDGAGMSVEPFQTVILSSGMLPAPGPAKEIRSLVPAVEVIGDAAEVRDIFSAVHAGYQLAVAYEK